MGIEIEKKFRLTGKQREQILERLPAIGAQRKGEEFEVNTLYTGEAIADRRCVLRLRRTADQAILTYKERFPTLSDIKHQREDETGVDDPEALELILEALGFTPALLYEKKRETWTLGESEIVIDELPFGLFMEIEGSVEEIADIESKLAIKRLKAEQASYPFLTSQHGTNNGGVIECRFKP
jgi:adenylate cyclase class 2